MKNLVGVDWGTSNRRAYLLDPRTSEIVRYEDSQGVLAASGGFEASLENLLQAMSLAVQTPVVMSGMVGSALGWQEVPYLDSAVPLLHLPQHLHSLGDSRWIVPGYCCKSGAVDVMRGEETQLLGAVDLGYRDGWIVLPGTHSKWVHLHNGVIERIRTYMTGEIFAMLSSGGTLSHLMAQSSDADGFDQDAFGAGLDAAKNKLPLTNALFQVRAKVVTAAIPAHQARWYVSGLLIGSEFAHSETSPEAITVIGEQSLASHYEVSAKQFSCACVVLDPHTVYARGLSRLQSALQ